MKKLVLCIAVLVAAVVGVHLWRQAKDRLKDTDVAVRTLGYSYEVFLVRNKDKPLEFERQKEFLSLLKAHDRSKATFSMVSSKYFNEEGMVVDGWKRPLKISPMEGQKMEVRSAGRDGEFGTEDDFLRTLPRENARW